MPEPENVTLGSLCRTGARLANHAGSIYRRMGPATRRHEARSSTRRSLRCTAGWTNMAGRAQVGRLAGWQAGGGMDGCGLEVREPAGKKDASLPQAPSRSTGSQAARRSGKRAGAGVQLARLGMHGAAAGCLPPRSAAGSDQRAGTRARAMSSQRALATGPAPGVC